MWQASWPEDLGAFGRDVLPALAGRSAAELAAATGLSKGYCRRILAGMVMRHPMWWEAIAVFGRPEEAAPLLLDRHRTNAQ